MTEDIRSVFDELRSPPPEPEPANDVVGARALPLSDRLARPVRSPQAPVKRVRLSATPWMTRALSDAEGRPHGHATWRPSVIAILAVLGATFAAGVVFVVELANPPKPKVAVATVPTPAPSAAATQPRRTSEPQTAVAAANVSAVPQSVTGPTGVRTVRTVAIDNTGAPAQKDPILGPPVSQAKVDPPALGSPAPNALALAAPAAVRSAPAAAVAEVAAATPPAQRTAAPQSAPTAPAAADATAAATPTTPAAPRSVVVAKPTTSASASRSTVSVDANMRGSKGGDKVAVVPAGAAVDLISCDSVWCEVNYGGKRGYVYRPFIKDVAATLAKR
ncbi:MAG: hypothetical protein U1E56_07300 [Bauldia sp.]